MKDIMQNGDSTLGIPVLDPFTADKLCHFGVLSNVKVVGLSTFEVNKADFSIITLMFNLDLYWPLITASADYSIDVNDNAKINGKGEVDVAVHDFRFQISINFKLKRGHIQIDEITNMYVGLKALDFYVTGLYKDDKKNAKLSKMIANEVPKLINENQDKIVNTSIKFITEMFNKLLSNVNLSDIINHNKLI
ncbi:hypothetical protein ALC62_02757 [Cyphomyrmex costatus]|uniref:Protein takeout n=1 Tax=Cyphomyrmex costatus TaxID=456900 RepID=A0A151IMT4_9HYME|nr:hypothetical protein ALC62_02757 [Cyphomyrmex costatus]